VSRSLRLAHLPPMHPHLRCSGYLTAPASDASVQAALAPFLTSIQLYRSRAALPQDWPSADDSMIQDPPPGMTPIWFEGDDVSAAAVIGDPETPWRLVVGAGQLVISDVWLYDAKADPWPSSIPTCPPCASQAVAQRPFFDEKVTPPAQCNSGATGILGAALGAVGTAAGLWWLWG